VIEPWSKGIRADLVAISLSILIRHFRHPSAILSERFFICAVKMAYLFSSFIAINSAIFVILSDISSDIPYEKPVAYVKIGLLETMIKYNGGMMVKLNEAELKKLIKGGETNTVELKLAAPRAVDLAERLCGMANAKGGIVIIGVVSDLC